jgi:malate dehydrogenase (oxaloacetate-decarboxylating)(NADP+)
LILGCLNEKILFYSLYFSNLDNHFLNQEYSEFLDEFMAAVRQNYGQKVLVQVWKIIENILFVS